MINVAHGSIFFKDKQVQQRVDELMIAQCSATRSAYQAIHKHGLKDNAVKVYVKKDYMEQLNQRYISDAVSDAKMINQDHAIFGGKRNWEKLQTGTVTLLGASPKASVLSLNIIMSTLHYILFLASQTSTEPKSCNLLSPQAFLSHWEKQMLPVRPTVASSFQSCLIHNSLYIYYTKMFFRSTLFF